MVHEKGQLKSRTCENEKSNFEKSLLIFKSIRWHLKNSTHLSTDTGDTTTVLELRWGEHATTNLHHVVADGEPELLNVGVVVEVGATNQIVDFTFAEKKKI